MKNCDLPAMPIGEQMDAMHLNAPCNGLTKREHFAGLFLQGFISNGNDGSLSVQLAVVRADELLEELERTK